MPWSTVASSQPVSHLLANIRNSLHSNKDEWINEWSLSSCRTSLPPSLSSLNRGLQVQLQTPSIPGSIYISQFTQSQSPSGSPNRLDHGLQAHLERAMWGIRWYKVDGVEQSEVESIFGRPRNRYASSHFHLILSSNEDTHYNFPNYYSHSLSLRFSGSTQLCGSSKPCSIISSHPLPSLLKPEPRFPMNSVWMLMCGGLLLVDSLPSSSIVSPQFPPSGASLSFLTWCVQLLLLLCSTIICGQIDHMYIYRET